MNKIYKVIWNKSLLCWQVVSELGKNNTTRSQSVIKDGANLDQHKTVSSHLLSLTGLGFALALLPLSIYAEINPNSLPTGATVTQGSAQFNQNNNTLNINQNTQNLSTNWNSFNIGQDATVNFNQPNSSSIAINRVLDSNASHIMGRLNANGQIFLLNPNGVVFSKTAQVNVGGIVASTLNLADSDLTQGKFTLKNNGSAGSVENYGSIIANGGVVAFIAPVVNNQGSIQNNGTGTNVVHLTAADQVRLQLQDGRLTEYKIDLGTLQGLVDNGGAIQANNGAVYLTAKAKDSLSKAVVNHTGIIEANRLSQNAKGEIILLGDMQSGETNVSGTLKAEGKNNGVDGGFIETSAAKVNIDQDINVSTLSDTGKTGEWLIDPYNVVISNAVDTGTGFVANQDDTIINATTLTNALATTGVTVSTGGTAVGTQEGNITVDADLAWSSNSTLTLQADKNINLNKKITATNGGLTLNATNNISANDAINVGTFTLTKGNWLQNTPLLPSFYAKDFRLNGGGFIRALGGDGSAATPWKLTDIYGVQGIGTKLSGNFALANDIDASDTVNWNSGAGFNPIGKMTGNSTSPNYSAAFSGKFDGLGHVIKNLNININNNSPSIVTAGLFGGISSTGIVNNIGLINSLINVVSTSSSYAGGLVGFNAGIINNSYADTVVNIKTNGSNTDTTVGGLVGWQTASGKISNAFATGNVKSESNSTLASNYIDAGGLVGFNAGAITNAYAIGSVDSISTNNSAVVVGDAGGLVGWNDNGTVQNSYALGKVTGFKNVGGLIGYLKLGTISKSFWNTITTGTANGIGTGTSTGITGLTTAQMKNLTTFTGAGWSISGVGGENTVWRIYDGQTAPLLRSFLTTLDLGTLNTTTTYNGLNQTLATVNGLSDNLLVSSGVAGGRNAGDYLANYYSNQQGYDLIGNTANLTINKAILNITATDKNKTYGDTTTFTGTEFTASGLQNGETVGNVNLSSAGASATASVNGGIPYAITASNATGGTFDASNYTISYSNGNLIVTKKDITVIANGGTSIYGDTNQVNPNFSASGLVNGETESVLTGLNNSFGINNVTNAGSYTLTVDGTLTNGNYNITQRNDGTWVVGKKDITVTANGGTSIYGDTNQVNPNFNASGLVNGETAAVLTGLNNSFAINNVTNAGSYSLTVDGTLTNGNYNITQRNDGTWVVAKANATVIANSNHSAVYNGKDQTVTGFTVTGLVNGETESVLTGVTASGTGKNAGSYSSKATGSDNNYNLTFVDGSLDIAKAQLDLNAVSDIRTYDGTNASTGLVSITGLQGNDSASATQVFDSRNAGNRTLNVTDIVINDGNNGNNYIVQTQNATGNINKALITQVDGITANSRFFDGTTNATLNFNNSQLLGKITGDDLYVVSAQGQFADLGIGQDKTVNINNIQLAGADAANYQLIKNTAQTTANMTLMTPVGYLQAIQFQPVTDHQIQPQNAAHIDVRNGGVNINGLQVLQGEH